MNNQLLDERKVLDSQPSPYMLHYQNIQVDSGYTALAQQQLKL